MNLDFNDTVIDRVRVGARPAERTAVVAALERANWPRAARGEWLFLREVRVKAPQRRLGTCAADRARDLAGAAVAAGAPGSERAQAVRFRDLAELLAWLSVDLAAGRADTRWYWKRWRHLFGCAAGEALTRLWEPRIEYLPALSERLSALGHLRIVWRALDPAQAQRLQSVLASRTGIRLAPPAQGGAEAPSMAPHPVPAYLLRRWGPVVRPLPDADPRRRLAALLIALECRPIPLRREPVPLLAAIGRALEPDAQAAGGEAAGSRGLSHPAGETAPGPPPGQPGSAPPRQGLEPQGGPSKGEDRSGVGDRGAHPSDRRAGGAPRPDGSGSEAHRSQATGPAHASAEPAVVASWTGAVPPGRPVRKPSPGEIQPTPGAPPGRSPAETSESRTLEDPAQPRAASPAAPAWAGDLYTEEGGLFLLINLMLRPEVQAVIERAGGWDLLPDGWAWLYRLGAGLGLDPGGVLAAFLAERIGLEGAADLAGLPPLPAGEELLACVERIYEGRGVWNPNLIRSPAWVRHTPSHLDVDFPMSSVRLEIRLAGLDLDPGWVPWLGRVVSFHYLEGLGAPGRDPR